jgi:AbrB family looped-hinge helix DNA binding protein
MLAELRAKSQITLPKPIVEQAGLSIGDYLDVTVRDGGVFILPVTVLPKGVPTQAEYLNLLERVCGSVSDPTFEKPAGINSESAREELL